MAVVTNRCLISGAIATIYLRSRTIAALLLLCCLVFIDCSSFSIASNLPCKMLVLVTAKLSLPYPFSAALAAYIYIRGIFFKLLDKVSNGRDISAAILRLSADHTFEKSDLI